MNGKKMPVLMALSALMVVPVLGAMAAPNSGDNLDVDATEEETLSQSREVDLQAIEGALNDYLYGSRDGEPDRLARAFHATAEIEGVRDGELVSWTAPDYVGGMTPGRVRDFTPRILAVDFTGTAAQAKVEADYGTWKFVDYMQLLKIDGEWKIMNKVYHRVVN